ncbi:MAG: HAD-IIIA family hydrolase [Cyclobacteriaceae bacterium]
MKAVFLDRDGVINRERGEYTFLVQDFELIEGVVDAIDRIKSSGYQVIVITNQAGIAKGLYTIDQMKACHQMMQEACSHKIDAIYFAPLHPSVSESLARKPGSLMFERAISKFGIDITQSWMIGDKMRDLIPAKMMGMSTILVSESEKELEADYQRKSLYESLDLIC